MTAKAKLYKVSVTHIKSFSFYVFADSLEAAGEAADNLDDLDDSIHDIESDTETDVQTVGRAKRDKSLAVWSGGDQGEWGWF